MVQPQINKDKCVPLASAPGHFMRADAAAAWENAVKAFGKKVLLTQAWRSYETQLALFTSRYVKGNHKGQPGFTNDVRYWNGSQWTRKAGTASAAVPGTSNHGTGCAVDVKTARGPMDPSHATHVVFSSFTDPDRLAFLMHARKYGWCDCEGRPINEHWHFTFKYAKCTCLAKNYISAPTTQTGFNVSTLPTIRKGALHNTVKGMQSLLNGHGANPPLKIDGDFGNNSETALKKFQKDKNLTQDSVCGPATWSKLLWQ